MNPDIRKLARLCMCSYYGVSAEEYETILRINPKDHEKEQRIAECLQVFLMEEESRRISIKEMVEDELKSLRRDGQG